MLDGKLEEIPTDMEIIAFIEQAEENDDFIELILDGVEKSSFEEITEENILRINLDFIKTQIFRLSLMKHDYQKLEDSNWIKFTISTIETEHVVNLYNDVFFNEEQEQLYIDNIQPIRIEGKKKIYSMEIFNQSSPSDIRKVLNKNDPFKIDNVIAYNVGQGNCNAITDSHGVPLLYFDFGGGVFLNTKTYPGKVENPQKIKFCYTYDPPVILSHWDWDHMASIKKTEHKLIKQSMWIVPKQEIGISHLKVAVELYKNGKLLVWPEKVNFIRTKKLEIQKLTILDKKDKNNNGLVLTIKIDYDKNNFILLPADANYELIKKKRNYIGMVATHHGASSHNCLNKIPKASKLINKIAYSFGSKNSFNHPKNPSISSHCLKGWSNVYLTVNGHISLGKNVIKSMPCGTTCTLGKTQ